MSDPRVRSVVVAGDGDAHAAQRRVCVTQSSDGQVNARGFCEGWWSALASVTARSLGSLEAAWTWSVKVPGAQRPATGGAPLAAANFSTARRPVFLEDRTLTSAGFPMATWPVLPTGDSPRFSSDL